MHSVFSARPTQFGRTLRLSSALVLGLAALAGCKDDAVTPPDTTAAAITIVSGNNQTGAINVAGAPLVVKVTNAAGDVLTGKTVNFTSSNGAVLGSASATTGSLGTAQTTFTNGSVARVQTVTASVSGVTPSVTFTLTSTGAGAATVLSLNSGNSQSSAGSITLALPLVVLVTDVAGNPVSNVTVSWTATAGTLTAATSLTNTAGLASMTYRNPSASGINTITATIPGVTAGVAFTATSTGSSASAIAFFSGNAQTGVVNTALPLPLVAKVTNSAGDPMAGVSVTFVSQNGGVIGTATSLTNALGTAQTTFTLGSVAGTQVVTATAAGVTPAISFTFTATGAGAATSIAVVSGNTQTTVGSAALALPLTVVVRDISANPVVGVTVNWTTNTGTLGAASSVTNALGQAVNTFTTPVAAGVSTVTATIATTAISTTFTETNNGTVPFAIAITSGNSQTGAINAQMALPLVVRVTNAAGDALTGAAVTFTTSSGGSFGTAATVTNASGSAQTTFINSGVAGAQTITATATGVATPVTFTETASATGAAASITVASGQGQTAPRSTALPLPLTVTVRDAGSSTVANAVVLWTTTSGTLSAASSTTNALGQASITFTNPPGAATVTITATLNGTVISITFTATST